MKRFVIAIIVGYVIATIAVFVIALNPAIAANSGSQVHLTAYVSLDNDHLRLWREAEPEQPHLWFECSVITRQVQLPFVGGVWAEQMSIGGVSYGKMRNYPEIETRAKNHFDAVMPEPLLLLAQTRHVRPPTAANPVSNTAAEFFAANGADIPFRRILWDQVARLAAWPVGALGVVLMGIGAFGVLRHRRRARRGQCVTCGYSLQGLADGAACPECGAARMV